MLLKKRQNLYYQQGLSLLELIVSLTIGLVILLGLGKIFQISNQASSQANAIIDVNEKGHRIMDMLGHDFENAGYIDLLDQSPLDKTKKNAEILTDLAKDSIANIYQRAKDAKEYSTALQWVTGMAPFLGCAGKFQENPQINQIRKDVSGTSDAMIAVPQVYTCNNTGDGNSKQSIQITYQSISNKDSPLKSLQSIDSETKRFSGAGMDCLGNKVDDSADGFVTNRYFLDGTSFKCQGSGSSKSTAQELVDDVDEFVLRYRITNPSDGDTKSGVKTEDIVSSSDLFNKSKNPLGLAGVTGIQVCLVISSNELGGNDYSIREVQPDIPSCISNGGKYNRKRSKTDNRYYKRFISTFSLPNLIYYSPSLTKA